MNKMSEVDCVIPIKGLTNGVQEYRFHIGSDLFEYFNSNQVSAAKMDAILLIEKYDTYLKIKCSLSGNVTVECDRCLEDLDLPVSLETILTVKFVKNIEKNTDTSEDFLFLEYAETELDLRQFIYDYTIINLPLQKVHDIDECNPIMIETLGLSDDYDIEGNTGEELDRTDDDGGNSPFSQLKNLLN